ncbi:MAG: 16S rRNA (uracil(1498)-N(3))-methyltransferase [bacterium]|nr:16S rRNA (uracil(1498)-N(3))-methyltransferase [bacterium]
MRRIYLHDYRRLKDKILISNEPAHYLRNVLRMNVGSRFIAFDGAGREYELEIKKSSTNEIETEIMQERIMTQKETLIPMELCISLCKVSTFENILKKASELGVTKISPIKSERSIIQIQDGKLERKLIRWKKIAAQGCKISGRTKIPEIIPPVEFKNIVKEKGCGILFWEQSRTNLKSKIDRLLKNAYDKKILRIFIGPEGGFTDDEINLAEKNDIIIVSLGPRILSVETATVAAISILLYEFENFNTTY